VISVEAAADGFALSVDGRPVFVHSARRPCLEIGTARGAVRRGRKPGPLHERKCKSIRLKAYRIEESTPDLVVIEFEGQLRLTARVSCGKLRITFSGYSGQINRFKLRIAAFPKNSSSAAASGTGG